MNSFVTSIFKVMLTGMQGLLNSFWRLGSGEGEGSLVAFLRTGWPVLVIVFCVGGFLVDRIVYVLRWRPYYVWSTTLRRWKRRRDGAPETEAEADSPHPSSRYAEPVKEEPAPWSEREAPHPMPDYAPEVTRRGTPVAPALRQTRADAMPAPRHSAPNPYAPPANMPRPALPYAPPAQEPQPVYRHRAAYAPPQASYAPPRPDAPVPQDTRVNTPLWTVPAPQDTRVNMPPAFRAPAPTRPERGMAELMDGITPSFGARQPAPPAYQTELPLTRAPQMPEQQPAPPPEAPVHPGLNPELFRRNLGLNEQGMPEENGNGAFFPNTTFVPYYQSPQQAEQNKPKKGLRKLVTGAGILSGTDERENLSIRDLQKTTDFRSAFHAPVYPKKPQTEEERPR